MKLRNRLSTCALLSALTATGYAGSPSDTTIAANRAIVDAAGFPFSDTSQESAARKGYLGFQDHGKKVWCRNVKIRELK